MNSRNVDENFHANQEDRKGMALKVLNAKQGQITVR